MKHTKRVTNFLSAILAVLLLINLAVPCTVFAAGEQQVVYADNAQELLQAIKSNTKIILEGKDYIFDRSLPIQNIENLTIEGTTGTQMLTPSYTTVVIDIYDSNSVTLKGIIAGHMQHGGCEAGVVGIHNSSVAIENCDLFGCGSTGISVSTSTLTVNNTLIRDCSRNIMEGSSTQAYFKNCTFTANGYLMSFEAAIGITNNGPGGGISSLAFSNCNFIENKNKQLVDKTMDVTFTNCTFTGNARKDETVATPSSGSYGSNLTWSIKDGTMIVSGKGSMEDISDENESTKWGGNCQNIKALTIESGITSISNHAFFHCQNLESVMIGEGVTSIEYNAFNSCLELRSVNIPKSVKSIGYGAFAGCTELKDIYYAGSEAEWNKIAIERAEFNDAINTATVHYGSASTSTTPNAPAEPTVGGFTDVKADAYYAEPVLWAVEKKITSGTSETTFSPEETCTNAQILSFLWRANGSPESTIKNPFTDVKTSDYYYKAALWAYENGLVSGTSLNGNKQCTRSMTVEYLWKAAGSPGSNKQVAFADVPSGADYAQAVAWAVEKGVTSGTGATTFSPNSTCTRAQIVTFLYRDRMI